MRNENTSRTPPPKPVAQGGEGVREAVGRFPRSKRVVRGSRTAVEVFRLALEGDSEV